MSISHRVMQPDVHLLKLNRPLSGRWAGEVEQAFTDLFNRGARRVVLNLEDVPFIDGHGLSVLVAGLKIFKNNAQNLHLIAPQEQPRLLFELTGFDKIFSIADSPAAIGV